MPLEIPLISKVRNTPGEIGGKPSIELPAMKSDIVEPLYRGHHWVVLEPLYSSHHWGDGVTSLWSFYMKDSTVLKIETWHFATSLNLACTILYQACQYWKQGCVCGAVLISLTVSCRWWSTFPFPRAPVRQSLQFLVACPFCWNITCLLSGIPHDVFGYHQRSQGK